MAARDDLERLEAENELATSVGSRGVRRNNRIAIAIFFIAAIVIVYFIFALDARQGPDPSDSEEEFTTVPFRPPQLPAEPEPEPQETVTLPPPPPPEETPAPAEPTPIDIPPPPTVTPANVPPPVEDDSNALFDRWKENSVVFDESGTEPGAQQDGALVGESGEAMPIEGDDNPNSRFLSALSGAGVETAKATRLERPDAIIPQGTLIRGVLETAIQSDLPGMVRAVVSEDVWSLDGRRILVRKGERLIGEYRSAPSRGQTRVFIVWTRLLRSDGVTVQLGSIGTDQLGRSGLTGFVDNHWFKRFGSSILLSIVGGGASYLAGYGSDSLGGSLTDRERGENIARETIAQTFAELANTALRENIDIPPTIHVDQGAKIFVYVRRDLDFSELYPDPVEEALWEIRRERASRNYNPSISK